jgi:hypothetical protein
LIFGKENYGVTKIKNTEFESVYACECKNMLRKDKNYMFVIGNKDIISIGSNVRMEDITNITCIQFRTFTEPILQKVLSNKIDINSELNNISIKRYNITKDNTGKISEYLFEYEKRPYNVHLFHTTDSDFEYVVDGTLYSAVITWNTMIMSSVDIVSKQLPPKEKFNVQQSQQYPQQPQQYPQQPQQYPQQSQQYPQQPQQLQSRPPRPQQQVKKHPTYSQYQKQVLPNAPSNSSQRTKPH